jgi:hypothetical protein
VKNSKSLFVKVFEFINGYLGNSGGKKANSADG